MGYSSCGAGGRLRPGVSVCAGGGLAARCYADSQKHQDKIRRAQKLLSNAIPYPLFVIGTRFIYGFRVISPTLIGTRPAAAENLSAAEYSPGAFYYGVILPLLVTLVVR